MIMLLYFESLLQPKRLLAAFILLGLVCVFSFFFLDKPLLLLLVALPLGEAMVYLVPAFLLLPVSFYFAKRLKVASYWQAFWRQTFASSLLIASSVSSSGLFVNGIKLLVGRYRPHYFLQQRLYGFQGPNLHQCMNSFPSGHSQAVWAAMVALCFLFPKWRWFFVAFAVTISCSRLITAYHYLSDVLMGGFLGLLGSVYFYSLLKKCDFFLTS
jgi:membrane-associated phospholipid phosphatase